MKRRSIVVLAALGFAAFVAGGCAKKEIVRSEEPMVKAEVAKAPEAAKVVVSSPAKVEVPQAAPQPVMPEQVPVAEPVIQPEVKAPVAETALENIYFNFDKSDLLQDARNVLQKNADILLKQKPTGKIQISGNCDERGSDEYNLALGERRAMAAKKYLITLGVPASRLTTISYGSEKPALEGHDEAAWVKNRRDEFVVVK